MKRIIAVLLLVTLLAGCGSPAKNVNMEELYASLKTVGMPEMVSLKADMMLDFYGIMAEDAIEVYHGGASEIDEAIGALMALGYSAAEAKRALSGQKGTVEELVKIGLKNLMKG